MNLTGSEHCFHIIRRWLRATYSSPKPTPTYPICRTAELNICSISPLSPHSRRVRAAVLPCTHMLCVPCLAAIVKTFRPHGDAPPQCPVCRVPSRATRCGHECVAGSLSAFALAEAGPAGEIYQQRDLAS